MKVPRVLAPELLWTGERFERERCLVIDDAGRIERVGPLAGEDPSAVQALDRRALLPGFVNAHSHAFQRGLRGRGERFAAGAGSFWTWRQAMYGLVDDLDADGMHALSLRAFREMLACGITSVGEFHYLHHDRSGAGWALDEAVVAAAGDAGIRLVLLNAYYQTGGIGRELEGPQLRFRAGSPDEFWRNQERLAGVLDPDSQALGCVVHSVRAASLADLRAVHEGSRERSMVFHMHLEEQPREIEECVAAHGRQPMELLLDELEVDERFTAVHCTHTEPEAMGRFLGRGGNVCICPLTEANLGDGIADLPTVQRHAGTLALGTDSNARISMLEEMRWLEYAQRLALEKRGVLTDQEGEVARRCLEAATRGGARSLGLDSGELVPGRWADFVVVDLDAAALAGCDDGTLLDALVFGAGDRALVASAVSGRWAHGAP